MTASSWHPCAAPRPAGTRAAAVEDAPDRQPIHRFEDLLEVGLLGDAQLLERGGLLLGRVGEDHLTDDREPIWGEEHVLGPAQTNPLGTHRACVGGVFARVGIGAHGELALANLIGPGEDRLELGRWLGGGPLESAEHDFAGGAVERQPVALLDHGIADVELLV
jgi:hypothetical protein